LKPKVWKNGFTTRYRSARVSRPQSAQARATASDRSCEVIAPLLRPVVPEVNMMSLTSCGRTPSARSRTTAAGTEAPHRSNAAQSSGSRTIRPTWSRAPPPVPSASAAAAAARSAASRSTPRKSPATNSARAPLRLITSSASGPVNRVLTGTSVAPALSAPSAASTQW
jgi:hypothetical protein